MEDAAGGDVLKGGGPPRRDRPRLTRRLRAPRLGPRGRWAAGIAAALAAVVALGLLQQHKPDQPATAASTTEPGTTSSPLEPEPTDSPSPLPTTGTVTGPGFFDPVAHWELFARTDTEVDRIQPRLARVTRTAVPRLGSSGPVPFLVTADRALIRPLDVVPGFDLPDGRAARPTAAALGTFGPAFAGPDPAHLWVSIDDGLVLRSLDGGPDADRIRLPRGVVGQSLVADGAGHLLYPDETGVYEVLADGLHRISPGALLAVGPRGWIVAECNDRHRCRSELVDRVTGARRDVGPPLTVGPIPGLISPDGRTAALYRIEDGGRIDLDLLDIASGEVRAADVVLEDHVTAGMLAWAPDGRLFAVAAGGALRVIDRDSGRAGPVGPPLPPVRQLAVRTT